MNSVETRPRVTWAEREWGDRWRVRLSCGHVILVDVKHVPAIGGHATCEHCSPEMTR